jgi:hypothetical protein
VGGVRELAHWGGQLTTMAFRALTRGGKPLFETAAWRMVGVHPKNSGILRDDANQFITKNKKEMSVGGGVEKKRERAGQPPSGFPAILRVRARGEVGGVTGGAKVVTEAHLDKELGGGNISQGGLGSYMDRCEIEERWMDAETLVTGPPDGHRDGWSKVSHGLLMDTARRLLNELLVALDNRAYHDPGDIRDKAVRKLETLVDTALGGEEKVRHPSQSRRPHRGLGGDFSRLEDNRFWPLVANENEANVGNSAGRNDDECATGRDECRGAKQSRGLDQCKGDNLCEERNLPTYVCNHDSLQTRARGTPTPSPALTKECTNAKRPDDLEHESGSEARGRFSDSVGDSETCSVLSEENMGCTDDTACGTFAQNGTCMEVEVNGELVGTLADVVEAPEVVGACYDSLRNDADCDVGGLFRFVQPTTGGAGRGGDTVANARRAVEGDRAAACVGAGAVGQNFHTSSSVRNIRGVSGNGVGAHSVPPTHFHLHFGGSF